MTYTRYDLTTLQNGRIKVRMETNDDNDDGYPDGNVSIGEWETSEKTAYEIAGKKSHTGFYGQSVDVYLDGKKI